MLLVHFESIENSQVQRRIIENVKSEFPCFYCHSILKQLHHYRNNSECERLIGI